MTAAPSDTAPVPPGTPPAARVFIAAVSVLGVLAVALGLTRAGDLTSGDLLALLVVAAAVVVADRLAASGPHRLALVAVTRGGDALDEAGWDGRYWGGRYWGGRYWGTGMWQ